MTAGACGDCGAAAREGGDRCIACASWRALAGSPPAGPDVRVLACAACAGPLQTPAHGGEARCPVCGLAVAVAPLGMDPLGTGGSGRAPSQDRYRGQLRSRQLPYDRSMALDAEIAELSPADPRAPFVVVSAWQRAAEPLREASSRRRAGGAYRGGSQGGGLTLEQGQRLAWVANRALALFSARGEPLRARPLLETAYELLADPAWRQLLLCDLSRMAEAAGELDAARAWLGPADPWPEQVEVHGATALQRARIAAKAGDSFAVLGELGRSREEMVLAPGQQIAAGLLRVAALERAVDAEAADVELAALVEVHLVIDLEAALGSEELLGGAQPAWRRLQARWAEEAARKRRRDLRLAALLLLAGVVFMPLGALVFYNGTTSELSCEAVGVGSDCRIVDKLLGSPVGERPLLGLSGAKVSSHRSDNQTHYALWLVTAGDDVELFQCGDCETELAAEVAKIDRFVKGESRSITVVEIGDNPLPFLGFALSMVGLSFTLMAAWRGFGAFLRRDRVA